MIGSLLRNRVNMFKSDIDSIRRQHQRGCFKGSSSPASVDSFMTKRSQNLKMLVDLGYGCNDSNVLFTLSGRNARDPNQVLLSLGDRVGGTSIPIEEIRGQVYVNFGALVNQHF
jgi:hypothetical protein